MVVDAEKNCYLKLAIHCYAQTLSLFSLPIFKDVTEILGFSSETQLRTLDSKTNINNKLVRNNF